MKVLIATLCLTVALLLGSGGSAFALPECEGSPARSWSFLPFLQDMSKNWDECEGSFTYGNGGKYVGEWRNGKRNGQGTFTTNSDKYVGEFRNDRRHGRGTLALANGQVKEGIWKDGRFQDVQKFTPPVDVSNSQPSSITSILPPCPSDQTQYYDYCFGTFTFRYGNGAKYVGEFRNDRRHGQGITYHADGTVDKEGIWKEDKFQNAQNVTRPVIVKKSPAEKLNY